MTLVNIVYFPGTNCHRETEAAFTCAGARVRTVFLSEALLGKTRIDDADIVCLPGGFSFGDHVRAGVLGGLHLRVALSEQLSILRNQPTFCICNGFQIGVEAGLFGPYVALTTNSCGTFRHIPAQAHVVETTNRTPWLTGLGGAPLYFPCAHGEGRFVYSKQYGWVPALRYPDGENPDGSMSNIAGITSANGLVFGLMNHPERNIRDPRNLQIFRNAVRAFGKA
jgi:phosphoribosylformylglycinamidine (FGAM) synthase-like amidotransferase family enzyme